MALFTFHASFILCEETFTFCTHGRTRIREEEFLSSRLNHMICTATQFLLQYLSFPEFKTHLSEWLLDSYNLQVSVLLFWHCTWSVRLSRVVSVSPTNADLEDSLHECFPFHINLEQSPSSSI